jgi:ankyrin repeat protein
MLAAAYGHSPVVHALLKRWAAIDKHGQSGGTPLSQAAEKGHLSVVEALVEQVDNHTGQTPHCLAAVEGHRAIVKTLLQAGATVNTPDKHSQPPLAVAVIVTT